MKVGFIGLGIMGSRMAAHLLAQGHDLRVHNRTPEKAQELLARGAHWADTPAEAAAHAEVLITMLAHPEAVSRAALGADGFLDALAPGALWLDSSTVHPAFSRRMAEAAKARMLGFLDAPVAGSKHQAQAAQLVFLVGGSAAALEQAKPVLGAMGTRTLHVGGVGMGTSLKLVFNHLLATTMTAFAEGVVLGEALGLSQASLLEVLLGSAVAPPYLMAKRDKLERGVYEPEFPLQWLHKDLQMVATAASGAGTVTPLASLSEAVYERAVRQGLGEEDFSAIYRHLQGVATRHDSRDARPARPGE